MFYLCVICVLCFVMFYRFACVICFVFYKFVLTHMLEKKHNTSRTYTTLERLSVCVYNMSSFCAVSLLALGFYFVVLVH